MSKPNIELNEKQEARNATWRFWKMMMLGGVICLGLLAVVAWICLFHSTPLEISKETTLITGPLKSDGKQVDYFRAVELESYPPTMKTDENGFRIIIREIGVSSESTSISYVPAQLYTKLGLDPSILPTKSFEDPYKFIEKYIETLPENTESFDPKAITESEEAVSEEKATEETMTDETETEELTVYEKAQQLSRKLERPWTLEEMPMIEEWLKTNSPALDVVVKAAGQPSFMIPLLRENETAWLICLLLPEVQHTREFGRGLQTRAHYRIAKGEIDKAIDDIIACKRLGRHVSHGFCMVSYLVGIAIEGIANRIEIAGSLEHQPSETQLQRLLDAYLDQTGKKLPARMDPETPIRFDHYAMMDIVQRAAHSRASETLECIGGPINPAQRFLFNSFGFNWNIVAKQVNKVYDHPEKLTRIELSRVISIKTLFPSTRSELMGDTIANLLLPAIEAFSEAVHRIECSDRMKIITLAMLIYEKQHGRLPPAWTVDKEDQRLHSWRVTLLPYLGDNAKKLYEKIRLDEPWDSEHNQKYHETAIPFYQCPSAELKPGKTVYTVVVGKKTAFRGSEGMKLDEFGPNIANLILVAERKTPVCWMDPDAEVAETDAKTEIGSAHPGVINIGFRSGGVHYMSEGNVQSGSFGLPDEKPDPDAFQKLLEGTAESMPE